MLGSTSSKMQCTPQEIEEKRRQAQLKLAAKKSRGNPNPSPLKESQASVSFIQSPQRNGLNNANFGKAVSFTAGSGFRTHNSKPYEKTKNTDTFYGTNNISTGTCYLISEERFAVELSKYSQQAIEVFKTIPTKSYNTSTRIWDFHIKDYDLLQQKFKPLHTNIVLGKIPIFALNCVKQPKSDYTLIDLKRIEEKLRCSLMPFQEDGVCYAIDKNGRCLIADDMGLGKTFQALAVASYYDKDWPLLIATTSSMKNTWEETIHEYMPSISVMHIQYMVSTKDYIGDAKILIVSHDLMSRAADKLLERNFGVLIIDESHIFKNFKTKCTKVATDLSKKAKRVILLSGTPALSRPSELYTQLAIIDEKFFGTFINFSKRYCDGKSTNFGWDATGKSNLQELEVILAKKFMIRRTKEAVLKNLPNKTQEVITLDVNLNNMNEEDRRALNTLAAKYNQEKKAYEKHALLLTFFSETAKIKIASVCSYILQTLEETNKFLVFGHHQIMLGAIEQVLVKKKKKYIRIDGNTPAGQRKCLVDKFQLDDSYCCAILSITAANAGITLTAAQLVLFAELHWNPTILSQAEARAHRIGQEGHVVVRYLLAPGTADDSIWPMLEQKQKILNEVGLSKDSFNNVTVAKQVLSKTEQIAECLHTSITSANTLDITTYFKSPEKSIQKKNCDNISVASKSSFKLNEESSLLDDELELPFTQIENSINLCQDVNVVEEKENKEEVDFFNDEMDDLLGNVDINY